VLSHADVSTTSIAESRWLRTLAANHQNGLPGSRGLGLRPTSRAQFSLTQCRHRILCPWKRLNGSHGVIET
jgi:hypothetical protein